MYDAAIEARVNRAIGDFLDEEYAARGDKLYQWYRNRFLAIDNKYLTETIGLAPYDRKIARFVLDQCRFATRFVEIGAALAQESMLIAIQGLPTFAVEVNPDNFDMMNRLRNRLTEQLDPALPTRMTPVNDFFPKRAAEYIDSGTVLAFPSLSWGITVEQEEEILDTMKLAGGVILGLESFFRDRTPEEQLALVAGIRKRGFDAPVEVYSWDKWEMGFRPNRIIFMKRL